jgi:hypothetical protein
VLVRVRCVNCPTQGVNLLKIPCAAAGPGFDFEPRVVDDLESGGVIVTKVTGGTLVMQPGDSVRLCRIQACSWVAY